jgi:hypothetical protein
MENNFDDIKNLEKKVLTKEEREKELQKIKFLILFVSFFIFLFVLAFLYINGFIFKKKAIKKQSNIAEKQNKKNNLYLTSETNLTKNKEALSLVNEYHLDFLYEDEYKNSTIFTTKEIELKNMSDADKSVLLNISNFFKNYLKNNDLYDCNKKIIDKEYLEKRFKEEYNVKININYFISKISFDNNKVIEYKNNILTCIPITNRKGINNKLYHIEKNKDLIKYFYKKYINGKETDNNFVLVFKYNEKLDKYFLERIENS